MKIVLRYNYYIIILLYYYIIILLYYYIIILLYYYIIILLYYFYQIPYLSNPVNQFRYTIEQKYLVQYKSIIYSTVDA